MGMDGDSGNYTNTPPPKSPNDNSLKILAIAIAALSAICLIAYGMSQQ